MNGRPRYYFVTSRGDSGYARSKETLRRVVDLYSNAPYNLEVSVYRLKRGKQ